MTSAALEQDPHKLREGRENILEVAIGHEVRSFRLKAGMTVAELSRRTGLSIGMLSKIEHGNTSPSLSTLQSLAYALSVPITSFFRQFEDVHDAIYTPAGEGVDVERRGTRSGQQYKLLGHLGTNNTGVQVEPYFINLDSETDVFPAFQHEGIETLYMIEGEMDYRHGQNVYNLKPGDTLFFDADAPHGPTALKKLPVRFLSLIAYSQSK